MSRPLRLLAVFAHPDDEVAIGGTLARYAHSGAEVTLVCATRGEAATIYCDDCATRETLAAVRTAELECACRQLGIQRLLWLDWPDGGVQSIPLPTALARLVPIIRRLRPHVLFTHPPHGGYPHPDHIGLHDRVLAAFYAAADPAYADEEGLPPWATPKLYAWALPETAFDLLPGLRDYRVHLNGQALPFVGEPAANIHGAIDTRAWVEARIAAWECHRSQHNPRGFFSRLPPELRHELYSREYLRLLAHHLPADPPFHEALEAGLTITDDG